LGLIKKGQRVEKGGIGRQRSRN